MNRESVRHVLGEAVEAPADAPLSLTVLRRVPPHLLDVSRVLHWVEWPYQPMLGAEGSLVPSRPVHHYGKEPLAAALRRTGGDAAPIAGRRMTARHSSDVYVLDGVEQGSAGSITFAYHSADVSIADYFRERHGIAVAPESKVVRVHCDYGRHAGSEVKLPVELLALWLPEPTP